MTPQTAPPLTVPITVDMHTVRVGDVLRVGDGHRTVIDMRVGLTGKLLLFADGTHRTLRPGTYLSGHRPWPPP